MGKRYRANRIEVVDDSGVVKNYMDDNGFTGIRYRDEYMAGDWIIPSGATAPDFVDATIGGIPYRMPSFDGGTTEETLTGSFEIPHDLALDEVNAGTVAIEWHVHSMASTNGSGTAVWFVDYAYLPPFAVAISQTTLSIPVVIAANKQYVHQIQGTEIPVPLGGFQIGGVLLFRLRRTPNNAADTYGSDILLFKTALHIPCNDTGSRQRYIK